MTIITLSSYLKRQYGQKIYKLSLESGCTCPNRDGTLGTGGCTFCSAGGSGEFAQRVGAGQTPAHSFHTSGSKVGTKGQGFLDSVHASVPEADAEMKGSELEAPVPDMDAQIAAAKALVDRKIPASVPEKDRRYIAYFQSYTNTYGDTAYLRRLYSQVIRRDDIVILSIGTRPDCIDGDKLAMLRELNQIKPVWVELGLQTSSDETAERIHRGYPTSIFKDSYERLKAAGLTVIVHVILGLPGEAREDMLATVRYLADLQPQIDGIKLQMLNILKGSALAEEYRQHPFSQMTMEEYCDLVVDCLKILPAGVVVHRMTGDGPRKLLISPQWVTDKKRVLNMLREKITEA